jgi:TPR repeat protein
MYEHGLGVAQSDLQTVSWYQTAVLGDASGEYYLGLMCKSGRGGPDEERL